MQITILLFGHYRDFAPAEGRLTIDVPEGTTVLETTNTLARRDARFANLSVRVRVAVNAEFADWDLVLQNGDEVALLPPMSGG